MVTHDGLTASKLILWSEWCQQEKRGCKVNSTSSHDRPYSNQAVLFLPTGRERDLCLWLESACQIGQWTNRTNFDSFLNSFLTLLACPAGLSRSRPPRYRAARFCCRCRNTSLFPFESSTLSVATRFVPLLPDLNNCNVKNVSRSQGVCLKVTLTVLSWGIR